MEYGQVYDGACNSVTTRKEKAFRAERIPCQPRWGRSDTGGVCVFDWYASVPKRYNAGRCLPRD